jgi:hypothetical protein
MNKFLSDDGYKMLYDDGDMHSMYRIHDNLVVEIVHNSHWEDDRNTVYVKVDDLRDILSEVDRHGSV